MEGALVRRCRPLLGTFVEVAVPAEAADAIDHAYSEIARVQAAMSFHDEASDLGRLRRAPAGQVVRLDRGTVEVLALAAELHIRSGGLFDVTVGRALVRDGFLPRPGTLDLRRFTGRAEDIEIVDAEHVRCRRSVLIDLGGIAKGFAVDRAINALQQVDVQHAIVNAGGDLRVVGPCETVLLRGADGRIEGSVKLEGTALASSSNLTHRRVVRGRITVPHRGFNHAPLPTHSAVSVIAPACVLADAMTKVALVDRPLAVAMLAERGGNVVARPSDRLAA